MPDSRIAMDGVTCPVCGARHIIRGRTPHIGDNYASTCEKCGHFFKFRFTPPFRTTAEFTVNGKKYTVGNDISPSASLNDFLRENRISMGTKNMCKAGGCGSCVVAVKRTDVVTGTKTTIALNSCLCPVLSCDGWEVTTVEGLGNKREGYDAIQETLAKYNGSQCGYCTPGQIMNMYALKEANPSLTKQKVEDSFDGQLCRCTGYRSILSAFKSLAKEDVPDIEDITKRCHNRNGNICSREETRPGMRMVLGDALWYKPTSLDELYAIVADNPMKEIRFTVGNTASGVHSSLGSWNYDIIIDIKGIETLYLTDMFPTGVFIGSAITISQLVDYFNKIYTQSGYAFLKECADYLSKTANLPVRNVACWAGNLMIKQGTHGFPSDMFTMLETLGALLTIGDRAGVETISMADLLQVDMRHKVISLMEIPAIVDTNVIIKFYRLTPRHQNAIGWVNCGIRMDLDKNDNFLVKTQPSIVFAGINSTMIHATQTEKYLLGRQLGDPATLQGAVQTLNNELVPDTHRVAGSSAYRKSAAVALFYKFVLSVCAGKVDPKYKSGGELLARPISSGQQTFGTDKSEWPLTEPIPKLSSLMQTSGEAEYISDVEPRKDEVYAAFVLSTNANATIGTMDATKALAYPGVLKFITHTDIPKGGSNNAIPAIVGVPEEVLSSGRVLYAGQPIGIIVADSQLAADVGAGLVQVSYRDQRTAILTIDEAIKHKSYFDTGIKDIVAGDAEGAIAKSPHQLSGSISCGTQYHFTMETQITICRPTDEGMDVLAATQWTDATQQCVAQVLGINNSKVHVQVKRIGGAYGSKITRNCLVSAACALSSYVMNRPVRMQLSLETNMESIGMRHAQKAEYQVGVSNTGLLNGIKITYYSDAGSCENDASLPVTMLFGDNCYYCENWHMIPYTAKTNLASTTACRSPGSAPGIFIMESIMEHIANALNMNPTSLRYLNLYKQGQVTPTSKMPLTYCNISSLMQQLITSADINNRQQQVSTFNQNNRWKKKGLSVVPMKFGIVWDGGYYDVLVTIYNGDGSVVVTHGGIESGQGINTKVAQVCAYELDIDLDLISILPTDTVTAANGQTTGGSITSELCCKGTIQCCQMLKNAIEPIKKKHPEMKWKELIQQCYLAGVDLSARYWLYPETQNVFQYNSYGVTATEVELDVLTGEHQITRVDILFDCGKSMNPEIDIGQAEGAFVMGLGYFLSEKIVFDTTGVLLTNRTWNYHPPSSKDIPIDFRIAFLENAPNPLGVLGSKAVGEPPLTMSCSVLFAIKHAMESARKDATGSTDHFELDAPATIDKIQTDSSVDYKQFTFGPS